MIGKLRHFLIIEARDESDDGAGGVSVAWVAIGTAWARIEPVSGREGVSLDREAAAHRCRVTVRYRGDLTPAYRFAFGGRYFDIQNLADRDGRKRHLVCDCVEAEQ